MIRVGHALGLLHPLLEFSITLTSNSMEILSFVTHTMLSSYTDSKCKIKLHKQS
jgi:hypothetical protein